MANNRKDNEQLEKKRENRNRTIKISRDAKKIKEPRYNKEKIETGKEILNNQNKASKLIHL